MRDSTNSKSYTSIQNLAFLESIRVSRLRRTSAIGKLYIQTPRSNFNSYCRHWPSCITITLHTWLVANFCRHHISHHQLGYCSWKYFDESSLEDPRWPIHGCSASTWILHKFSGAILSAIDGFWMFCLLYTQLALPPWWPGRSIHYHTRTTHP